MPAPPRRGHRRSGGGRWRRTRGSAPPPAVPRGPCPARVAVNSEGAPCSGRTLRGEARAQQPPASRPRADAGLHPSSSARASRGDRPEAGHPAHELAVWAGPFGAAVGGHRCTPLLSGLGRPAGSGVIRTGGPCGVGEREHGCPAGPEPHHVVRLQQRVAGPRTRRGAAAVAADPPARARAGEAAISSAEAGTTWRWAISRLRLPITCSASGSFPERRRSASSWVPSTRLMPAERARPNRRTTCSGGDGRELVDEGEHPHRPALRGGDDRLQVLHDRGGQHLAEQRPAVRAQREQDDRPLPRAGQEIDRLRVAAFPAPARRRRRTPTAPRAGRARRRGRRAGAAPSESR